MEERRRPAITFAIWGSNAMRCDAMRVGVKDEEEERERAREGEGRRVELPAKRRSNFFWVKEQFQTGPDKPKPQTK